MELLIALLVVLSLAALVGAAWNAERTAPTTDGTAWGIGGLLRFFEDGEGVQAMGLGLLAGFALVTAALIASWIGTAANLWLMLWAVVLVRALLLAAVIFMYLFPDLSQFEAKSLTWRTVVYPSMAAAVPVAYLLRVRSPTRAPYPFLFDLSLVYSVTFDIVSNDLHWYGTWPWWDDFVHLTNSLPLMVVIGLGALALEHRGHLVRGFWGAMLFAYLAYFALHGLWEIFEHLLDQHAGTNLQPGGMVEATSNNLLGIVGAALGVTLIWSWRWRGRLEIAGVRPVAALMER